MEHHFKVEEAMKYGIEKAVLLYNIRFWLEKNKANGKHAYKSEKDGKTYYWTFNSSEAFSRLFPYMKPRTIRTYFQQLEDEGAIISGKFNKNAYDQTKWYTIPEYIVTDKDILNTAPLAENADLGTETSRPIPDSNTDNKHSSSHEEKSEKISLEEFRESKGLYQDCSNKPDAYDNYPLVWYMPDGRVAKKQDLAVIDGEYRQMYPPEKPQDKPESAFTPLGKVFYLFKEINASWTLWGKIPIQRESAQELLTQSSIEEIKNMLDFIKEHKDDQFCPKVFSPYDLLTKMPKLIAYYEKQQ